MKKLLYSLCAAALMFGSTGCQQQGTDVVNGTETSSAFSSAFNDSISEALGNYYGSLYFQDFSQRKTPIDHAQFLKGIRTVFTADTATFVGITVGLSIESEMETAPFFAKIDFDAKVVNERMQATLNLDSVPVQKMQQFTEQLDRYITKSMTDSCQALNNSCSICYGELIGMRLNSDLSQRPKKYDKKGLAKGISLVLVEVADNESFSMGLYAGAQLRNDMTNFCQIFDFVTFNNGIVLNSVAKMIKKTAISPEDMTAYKNSLDSLSSIVQHINDNRQREIAVASDEAIVGDRTGKAFIDNLKKNDPEIKTSASGLCYKIINPGEDPKPTPQNTLVVHYTGKHIDGTIFDSSVERGEPAEFMIGQVIPGFGEGLQLIGKGGKAVLYIPGELGYGPEGTPGGPIKPNETLIFEIELIDIK